MPRLNEAAKTARITKYRPQIQQRLSRHIIDCDVPAFDHLRNDKGEKMESLNGCVLLELHLAEDGSLKGVISADIDDLASILPNIKKDRQDGTDVVGWKKHLDMFETAGDDILTGVLDPTPDEEELSVREQVADTNIDLMSDHEAKQLLEALQVELGDKGAT